LIKFRILQRLKSGILIAIKTIEEEESGKD
jgi:hypothetical protein